MQTANQSSDLDQLPLVHLLEQLMITAQIAAKCHDPLLVYLIEMPITYLHDKLSPKGSAAAARSLRRTPACRRPRPSR